MNGEGKRRDENRIKPSNLSTSNERKYGFRSGKKHFVSIDEILCVRAFVIFSISFVTATQNKERNAKNQKIDLKFSCFSVDPKRSISETMILIFESNEIFSNQSPETV